MISASIVSCPSRRRLSRFSPTWAVDSSFGSPRHPHVPLIVWIVRKMLPIFSGLPGSVSRATKSRSSRSRFS